MGRHAKGPRRGPVKILEGAFRAETKHCKKCDTTKSIQDGFRVSNYTRLSGGKGVRIATHCLECERANKALYYQKNQARFKAYAREYYSNNAEECRARDRASRKQWKRTLRGLGMTPDDYQRMYLVQKGECLVCKTPKERLSVDHCHTTKKVRGLLCGMCNLALGNVKENAAIAESLIRYIQQFCSI